MLEKDDCKDVKIPKEYSNRTLVGNWYEERLKYVKRNYKHKTIYSTEYCPKHVDILENRLSNLDRKIRNNGYDRKYIMYDSPKYDNNLISLYDENYNRRPRMPREPRRWNSQKLEWEKELSDYPLMGEPTNWGLKEHKEALRKRREWNRYDDHYVTHYETAYPAYCVKNT